MVKNNFLYWLGYCFNILLIVNVKGKFNIKSDMFLIIVVGILMKINDLFVYFKKVIGICVR